VTAPRSRWLLVVLLVAGCGLMLPFDLWFTRLAGMACLFAFIVLGVFLIAEPGFVGAAEDEEGATGGSGSADETAAG
jgi:hypothetical protein